jgi:spore maturation protein CgeB
MAEHRLGIVILGLSITSSWGNGHATTWRALVKALAARGHDVLFLERDVPWYAAERDLPEPPWGRTELYRSLEELVERHGPAVRGADLVIVGSYVPEGVAVGEWVTRSARGATAFYDIDTPITVGKLESGDTEYLSRALVPRYDLYFSFTGGPILERLQREFGAHRARPLYCSVDPDAYAPREVPMRWDMGYLGTYSPDRQPGLERLLLEPAARWSTGRFVVAGPQYPDDVAWPPNVERIDHVPAAAHAGFYAAQRCTLNLTRARMVSAGWSPSVRLFEAASCGTPILSDPWRGLEAFFTPGEEILVVQSAREVLEVLRTHGDEALRRIGARARRRVLDEHTAKHRALEIERHVAELPARRRTVAMPDGRLAAAADAPASAQRP